MNGEVHTYALQCQSSNTCSRAGAGLCCKSMRHNEGKGLYPPVRAPSRHAAQQEQSANHADSALQRPASYGRTPLPDATIRGGVLRGGGGCCHSGHIAAPHRGSGACGHLLPEEPEDTMAGTTNTVSQGTQPVLPARLIFGICGLSEQSNLSSIRRGKNNDLETAGCSNLKR